MVCRRPHPTHYRRRARPVAATLLVVGAVVAAGRPGRRPAGWRRVTVSGPSMLPGLEPGDRLVVVRPWPVRPGQVVAVADPRAPGRLMVKRVAAVTAAGVDVRGDNAGASTDSRHFGPVPRALLRGRAVYRYFPPPRVRWWP